MEDFTKRNKAISIIDMIIILVLSALVGAGIMGIFFKIDYKLQFMVTDFIPPVIGGIGIVHAVNRVFGTSIKYGVKIKIKLLELLKLIDGKGCDENTELEINIQGDEKSIQVNGLCEKDKLEESADDK